jgi:antitoxin component of MazEF toxin-antitoxin module
MRLNVVKGALVPAADADVQVLRDKQIKIGQTIEVELVNDRNAAFNSKVFATLAEIAKMLDITPETFRAEIAYETGRGEDLHLRNGDIITVLPSMSKLAMTQAELTAFWDDAQAYILKEVMISLDGDQQARVLQMFGVQREDEEKVINPLAGG